MDLIARIGTHFTESIEVKKQCEEILPTNIALAAECLVASFMSEGKVLACGNGGSAADAQHFSAELVGRFEKERPGLASIALTTDTSALTAIGNDYDFELIFSKQVRALGQANDVLVAISTSGNSANVLEAVHAAHEKGMKVIALTGKDGGQIAAALTNQDILLNVPYHRTARIQEVHITAIHALCDAIDFILLGGE
ncbi:phosphoheptose isomerase [Neisseria sp. Ec49-e6-T10]|uniref:phosphoheptose isomerase n=1 Tax=Neisseria sp. Ec49-e6-T10 TaxID=3140744 RepID=UPI003EBF2B8F